MLPSPFQPTRWNCFCFPWSQFAFDNLRHTLLFRGGTGDKMLQKSFAFKTLMGNVHPNSFFTHCQQKLIPIAHSTFSYPKVGIKSITRWGNEMPAVSATRSQSIGEHSWWFHILYKIIPRLWLCRHSSSKMLVRPRLNSAAHVFTVEF